MFGVPFIPLVLATLFLGLLAFAIVCDVTSLTIPNRISMALVGLYPAYILSAPMPVDWQGALAVAALVFAAGFIRFARGAVGGGDVKLLSAVALWAGPAHILQLLVLMGLIGGALAIVMLTPCRLALASACEAVGQTGMRDAVLRKVIPYGVAIASAAAISVGGNLVVPAG